MVLQRTRRAAAALALAATFALAAPAHAAGWRDLAAGPGWIEKALEWIAQLWMGGDEAPVPAPAMEKCGMGVDPSGGCSGGTSSPQPPPASSTSTTDPKG